MPALAQTDPTAIKAFVEITQSVFVCFAVGNSAVTHPPTPGKTHFLKSAHAAQNPAHFQALTWSWWP